MMDRDANQSSLSPRKKAGLTILGALLLNAAIVYLGVLPMKARIATTEKAVEDTDQNNAKISEIINTTNDKKALVQSLNEEHTQLVEQGLLTPLLNSYTMRAKTIIEPYARLHNLNIEDVAELPMIPMKRPPELKEITYARLPIEFTTSGSYTQLTAFIMLVEKELPMTALSSLKITPQNRDPEKHLIQVCFEWPVETPVPSKP